MLIMHFTGDEPLPTFHDLKRRKRGKEIENDGFINDGPIVVGESFRRKVETPEEKKEREKEQAKLQDEEERRKKRLNRKPPEAKSFDELMKLAQVKAEHIRVRPIYGTMQYIAAASCILQ